MSDVWLRRCRLDVRGKGSEPLIFHMAALAYDSIHPNLQTDSETSVERER